MKEGFLNLSRDEMAALSTEQMKGLFRLLVESDTAALSAWLDEQGWKHQRVALACIAVATAIIGDKGTSEVDRRELLHWLVRLLKARGIKVDMMEVRQE